MYDLDDIPDDELVDIDDSDLLLEDPVFVVEDVEYEDDGEYDSFEDLIGFDETPELEDEYIE